MDPVIYEFLGRAQAGFPLAVLNSPGYRQALPLTVDSAAAGASEQMVSILTDWVWALLGDPALADAVPPALVGDWAAMVTGRDLLSASAAARTATTSGDPQAFMAISSVVSMIGSGDTSHVMDSAAACGLIIEPVSVLVSDEAMWTRADVPALITSLATARRV